MTQDKMASFISGIEAKLGKENSSIISDDLGLLITDNEQMIKNENNLKNEINNLKDKNSKLVDANSSLLQQVGQINPKDVEDEKPLIPETKETISLKDCFKNGKFIQ